jgi:hypothetical protein
MYCSHCTYALVENHHIQVWHLLTGSYGHNFDSDTLYKPFVKDCLFFPTRNHLYHIPFLSNLLINCNVGYIS